METRGLSIAHAACALTGAMPPTGVFVRTSLNLSLGAVHRSAQLMQAVIVGAVTLTAMPLFQLMPLPTIAALLAVAAARMCPSDFLSDAWRHSRADLALCLLTALLAVAADMVVGLLVGTVVALLRNAALTASSPLLVRHAVLPRSEHLVGDLVGDHRATTITVLGPVTYVNAHEVTRQGLASPYAAAHSLAPSHTLLDLHGVIATDWQGLGALYRLLVELDARAVDGAAVVGPDGLKIAFSSVEGQVSLEAIVRSQPHPSQYELE